MLAQSTHTPTPDHAERSNHFTLTQVIIITLSAVLVVYTGFEIAERTWFQHLTLERQHLFLRLRVFFSILAVAAVASWAVLRRSPPLFGDAAQPDPLVAAERPSEQERTAHYANWFIRMRWVAALTALLLVIFAIHVVEQLPSDNWPFLLITIALLASLNFTYGAMLRARVGMRYLLQLQAYGDLVVLVLLLHYAGGVENPLSMLLLFHVIIGGIVLSRRQCYSVAAVASVLFALLVFLEGTGLINHYTLLAFPHVHDASGVHHAARDIRFALSAVIVQTSILFLTAYFTTTMTERLRRDEVQMQRYTDRILEQTQQILKAEKLAAAGELAGKVAHEVNNPIAIISAKARLLLSDEREQLSAKSAAELHKIADLADRVARIAQGLLSYCRPVPGPAELIDVRETVGKALATIEVSAATSDVQLFTDLPAEPCDVYANGSELEQVFLNLFLNALDAMPNGGRLVVSARADAVSNGEPSVQLLVEDTGQGVPPHIREHIFEPFVTTKTAGRGTGLGLAICRSLVRANGGEITLESEPGHGTCILLRFPLQETSQLVVSNA